MGLLVPVGIVVEKLIRGTRKIWHGPAEVTGIFGCVH
jgi:hypothetical protein